MPLYPTERDALVTVICRFQQKDFSDFLILNDGPSLQEFSAITLPIMSIAADFIGWTKRDGKGLPQLLQKLASKIGNSDERPVIEATARRLLEIEARVIAAGRPTDTRLACGMPIINRSALRQHLQDAVEDASRRWTQVKAVKVHGERGYGRTYSWYLIKHVADSGVAKAHKVDLISATLSNQTLSVLFDTLVRALGIIDAQHPTSDGVTSDTLAARYAEEFAGCLSRASRTWDVPLWLVFDSLDRELKPEVKRFVALLTQARLEEEFDRCVIFLLGPDAVAEPVDFGRIGLSEPLGPFTDQEIEEAAQGLNALGAAPLTPSDLERRIMMIRTLSRKHSGSERCKAVCAKLVELRVEVRA